jgi:hypothetical protein
MYLNGAKESADNCPISTMLRQKYPEKVKFIEELHEAHQGPNENILKLPIAQHETRKPLKVTQLSKDEETPETFYSAGKKQSAQPIKPKKEVYAQEGYKLHATINGINIQTEPLTPKNPEEYNERLGVITDWANRIQKNVPKGLTKSISNITLSDDFCPAEAAYTKKIGMEGFHITATVSGPDVTVWKGCPTENIKDELNHELGHTISRVLYGSKKMHPPEWEAIMKKDYHTNQQWPTTSDYSDAVVRTNFRLGLAEDFAESFKAYHNNDQDFRHNFPEKWKFIDNLHKNLH